MHCAVCRKGDLGRGVTTVTLTRGDAVVVVRRVPAMICDNCGEEYLDEGTSARVLAIAEDALGAGKAVDVREYVAA